MEGRRVRRYLVYDPLLGKIVASQRQWTQTTALRDSWEKAHNHWSICTLCWRQTEYAETLLNARRFRQGPDGRFESVSPPERARIARWAKRITVWYERALRGEYGQFAAGKLLVTFCDFREADGIFRSPADFYDSVERHLLRRQWAKLAPYPERLYWPAALSELAGEGSSRDKQITQARYPSAVYCEGHNPNRSTAARSQYQRDRRPSTLSDFRRVYEVFRAVIRPGAWKLEDISRLRRFAYLTSHAKRHHVVRHLVEKHDYSLAGAGRLLGISRQAASAALSRHPNMECPVEEGALIDELQATIGEQSQVHSIDRFPVEALDIQRPLTPMPDPAL